jgi:tetratricopeptide (TPR) repeat protein
MSKRPKLTNKELEALEAAEDAFDVAAEATDPVDVIASANVALMVSPLHADAYISLAMHSSGPVESLLLWETALRAAELVLGDHGFEDYAGEFWGIHETRPFMRAKHGLAMTLWELGERKEAIGHLSEMLTLNPNDNQGIRHILINWLIAVGHNAQARRLLERYSEDESAQLSWPAALLSFRAHGECEESQRALAAALESNPHVAAYLTGKKKVPKRPPEYYQIGEASEAVVYMQDGGGELWTETPDAIAWLKRHAGPANRRSADRSEG